MEKSIEIIDDLIEGNKEFISVYKDELKNHIKGQKPKVAVITCSDSRVIPELIFNKSIGEIFVIRVAGNVALGESVISSLEYAVDHLKVELLLFLAHTRCGAIEASEEEKNYGELFEEIREGFSKNKDHCLGNLENQLEKILLRSKIIYNAVKEDKLKIKGAIYHIETGKVEFL